MCDLAINQSNSSVGVRNDIPASGVVYNTTGKGDGGSAEDKGQNKDVNSKESKPEQNVECGIVVKIVSLEIVCSLLRRDVTKK